jgi:hypothetical protein
LPLKRVKVYLNKNLGTELCYFATIFLKRGTRVPFLEVPESCIFYTVLSHIKSLRNQQDGFWISWSNLLDVYTTSYNSSQITIWHTVIFFRLRTPLELFGLPTELSIQSQSQSKSYVTTDGQSASLSWNKAPIWGLRPDLYYCQTIAGLLMWGAFSDERTGLSFTVAAGPRQSSHSTSESRGDRGHILLYQTKDFLFVASYDSQGHGGCIRPRLHTSLELLSSQSQSQSYVTTDGSVGRSVLE